MINKVSINDKELFNEIGFQVNNNFSNLFNLDFIIESDNEDVFGYYDNNKLVGFIHVLHSFECLEIINKLTPATHKA